MPVIRKNKKTRLKPAQVVVLSFLCLIFGGTALLCLPVSSKSGEWTPLFDSFFTATSAACVTGLNLFDTFTQWSFFGQCVLMLVIQIGGLGIITLATFFNLALGRKIGLVHASEITGDFSLSGLPATRRLFLRIIRFSAAFEIAGALLLMIDFVPKFGGYGVFMSFFTAVSSFCNAGFDLMGIESAGGGFADYTGNPLVMITISILIILGGLGFVVWENFANYRKERKISLHTKTVLITTGLLLLVGAAFYLLVSYLEPELFGGLSLGEHILSSAFASASARTAGFTAADLPLANEFSRVLTMALMFVGASPASTAGGVKTTTIAILFATIVSNIKGRDETQLFGHLIPKKVVYKTLTVFSLSLGFVTLAFVSLYLLNPHIKAMNLLYELFSAFSTTGLSCGVCAEVGNVSRGIICLAMFVGRVGPVSLLLSLTQGKADDKGRILPTGEIMIG